MIRLILRALGWRMEGAAPQLDKYVLIMAPHTSNWDFPLMLAARSVFGVSATWMGINGGRPDSSDADAAQL